ncbi:MAG: hypothetical protein V4736_15920 [Bdellovibrionota bacterium]
MNTLTKTIAALMLISSSAFSAAALPEEILVTKITQYANLMPPITTDRVSTTIDFEALSGGCTNEKDFELKVTEKKVANEVVQLVTIVRLKPDFCEAVLHNKVLKLETNLLSARRILIQNPTLVEQNFVH